MKKSLNVSVAVAVAGLLATAAAAGDNAAKVERGRYLANGVGCHDCHSPKVFTEDGLPMPDETRLFAGHLAGARLPDFDPAIVKPGGWVLVNDQLTAFVGPWGISFGASLTPDKDTGIGLWTEEIFISALRTGKHMGQGRPILPPMPWHYVKNLSDEDLGALYAYFMSLPPVKNPVPAPVPPSELGGEK